MEITSAVVYKLQLQTALEKKTADVFCKNLKKRSGVSLLQSKTSGKISIEFYKEDSCSEEIKALFDGITVPGKEGFRIRVIDNPDGSGRIVVLGKDERGEFYGMARLLRKAIVKKYANLDENGEPVVIGDNYDVPNEKLKDFEREIKELGEQEVNTAWKMIKLDDLESAGLAPIDYYNLDFMIEE